MTSPHSADSDYEFLQAAGQESRICAFCKWSRTHTCTGRTCDEAIQITAAYIRQNQKGASEK